MKNLLAILVVLLFAQIGFGQKEDVIEAFNGTGYHEMTNVYGQTNKKGFFKNYQLIDGLLYKYDKYNRFIKIEIYKNAKFVKDSAVVYPPIPSTIEGHVELNYTSLKFTIVTENMNNEPRVIIQQGKDKQIFQKYLPSSDTTAIDFGGLNLDDGVYYVIVKDSISPRISESFVVGNVGFPLK